MGFLGVWLQYFQQVLSQLQLVKQAQADCQVVRAPHSTERLVPARAVRLPDGGTVGADDEIRLTYGELTALIEDAVRQLK